MMYVIALKEYRNTNGLPDNTGIIRISPSKKDLDKHLPELAEAIESTTDCKVVENIEGKLRFASSENGLEYDLYVESLEKVSMDAYVDYVRRCWKLRSASLPNFQTV